VRVDQRIKEEPVLSVLTKWVFLFIFVVQIFDGVDWNDASSHTLRVDAERQIEINASHGIPSDKMRVVEKDSFNPSTTE